MKTIRRCLSVAVFWLLLEVLDVHEKFFHQSQSEGGEVMLSKAEIELFWAVHSEALVSCFLSLKDSWFGFWCTFFLFYTRWLFATKVRKDFLIKWRHHDTKILFWGCDSHFSRTEMCVLNGIRNTVARFTKLIETMNESVNARIAGCKLKISARTIFL